MPGNLLECSHTTGKAYKHSGFTTTIDSSFARTSISGITWDGTDVYFGDLNEKVARGTGFGVTVQSSFSMGGANGIYGLDFLGSNLLLVRDTTKITQHSGFSSTISSSIVLADNQRGVAYDGTNLLSHNDATKSRLHSGFSTTISNSFTLAGSAFDVSWDGTNLLSQDGTSSPKRKRLHTGFSSTVTDSIAVPAGATNGLGIDWDGFPTTAAKSKRHMLLGVGS